jgi:phage terminase large subunit-like protein
LAPAFFEEVIRQYAGTRLGRQELLAEILDDNPNALWHHDLIDANRLPWNTLPNLFRIVVAVDPSVSDASERPEMVAETRAECGIIVCGIGWLGPEIHAFVLEDCSLFGAPIEWANAACDAYTRWSADLLVGEVNNGGALVETVLRTVNPSINFEMAHASRGKVIRAEPVSALYERHLVHHLGLFAKLEDQMCEWMPGFPSPDRMDALVWGLTVLMLKFNEVLFASKRYV